MSKVTKAKYDDLMADRPRKFDADQVGYRKAPRGSEQRCENCMHFYTRKVDGLTTCEIFRNDDTDEAGVNPKYLCDWWSRDGTDHPLSGTDEGSKSKDYLPPYHPSRSST